MDRTSAKQDARDIEASRLRRVVAERDAWRTVARGVARVAVGLATMARGLAVAIVIEQTNPGEL